VTKRKNENKDIRQQPHVVTSKAAEFRLKWIHSVITMVIKRPQK